MGERLDPQKQRVYDAEYAAFATERARGYLELAELQGFLDEIVRAPWFRARWPGVRVPVLDGRGWPEARASVAGLQLPKHARFKYFVLHELTHWIDHTGGEDHGSVFCGLYLHFVEKTYGTWRAGTLAKEFRARGVAGDKWTKRYGRTEHP